MFENLKSYRSIAWDFDDTLINHPESESFWNFIEQNPYGQVHHIVTMRSHGEDRRMFSELADSGSDLSRSHFERVIALPNVIYETYMFDRENGVLDQDHDYFRFKGMHCQRIGAEVLVDDMEAAGVSKRGCDIYGIVHIHPDDLR